MPNGQNGPEPKCGKIVAWIRTITPKTGVNLHHRNRLLIRNLFDL